MATHADLMQRPFDALGTAEDQIHFMVDPKKPLHYALRSPVQPTSTRSDDLARATSKKRRPASGASGDLVQPPAAPEVPKAPPISYKLPPTTNGVPRPIPNYPTSFAERARHLAGQSDFPVPPTVDLSPVDPATKRERRTSLNRPIGGVYTEIQQYKRDSQSSTGSGPTSPRRSSSTPRTLPLHSTEVTPVAAERHSSVPQPPPEVSPPSSQSTAIRRSPLVERSQPKEWASDRSPLQKLEVKLGDISKEEKRARVQQAEQRLRRSQAEPSFVSREGEVGIVQTPSGRSTAAAGSKKGSRSASGPTAEQAAVAPISKTRTRNSYPDKCFDVARDRQPNSRISETDKAAYRPSVSENYKRSEPVTEDLNTTRGSKVQSEQGVRFQRPVSDIVSGTIERPNKQQTLERLDLDPASAEIRAARREQLRQRDTMTQSLSMVKATTPQQKALYQERASHEKHPKAHRTNSSQQIGASFREGNNAPQERRHHFSNLITRQRNRDSNLEQDGTIASSEVLAEWRGAGVARLTASDFVDEDPTAGEQSAWWEKNGSGRRRKSQRSSKSAGSYIKAEQPAYLGSTGKPSLHLSRTRHQPYPPFKLRRKRLPT